jgi:dTDP-4-amino-4,6-dideoxygalactose transaminase
MDERALADLVGPRTRAIVPLHYAGVACEMDAILALARERGVTVIEDNAHGLFARYRGKLLGTLGALATQSFHETKNLTCGEGGALVINDPRLVDRAEIIREKGTDRSRFYRGEVDRYTWRDVGSSYLPSEILAAYLLAQLEGHVEIQRRRHEIWSGYASGLAQGPAAGKLRLPIVPSDCQHPAHLFYVLTPSLEVRTALLAHLRARQVLAVFHYQPLHLSAMGRRLGGRQGQCPVTEDVADRLVRLPCYFQLRDAEQARVLEAVHEALAEQLVVTPIAGSQPASGGSHV